MKIFKLMLIAVLLVMASLTIMTVIAQEEPTPSAEDTAEDIVDITVDAAEETATALDDFIDRVTSAPQTDLARILLVVGGVVLLVAGWRVYDFIVIIAGFLIGASIAAALVTTDSTVIAIAALLIGGFIGAALGIFLYYVAVFLIGAYIGIVLTAALASALSLTPVSALALFVGAIIGGMVLIALSFEFLILLSSLVGGQMLSLGLGLGPAWTVVFVLAGVIIQFMLVRSFKYDFRRRRRVRLFA